MPIDRLDRARQTLPPDYQFGDGDIVDVTVHDLDSGPLLFKIPRRHLPRIDTVYGYGHTQSVAPIALRPEVNVGMDVAFGRDWTVLGHPHTQSLEDIE